jgi:putative endonuclease
MTLQKERGNFGEKIAHRYLQAKGLIFVTKNYHCRYGEVDLIFRSDTQIIFVEVKLRTGDEYLPHESVNFIKQRKLILTAEDFLQRRHLLFEVDWRFDVVEIILQGTTAKVRHFESAFEHF